MSNDWNDAERRVEKAQRFFEQCKWNEALREMKAAVEINPYNAAWFFNMGLIYDEMGRFDQAADAYRQSLELESDDVPSLHHLGVDLYRTNRLKDALEIFQKIQTIDPAFEPAYCDRIIIYTEMGNHELAEEMFYTARLYKEHCPHCYYNLGFSLESRGLYDKAIYCWTRSLDLDGAHEDVHFRIAHALRKKGELEQARLEFLHDLRDNPGRIHSLLDLGQLLTQMGRLDAAGEKFRQAIELAPNDSQGYYGYGCWLAYVGQDEPAMLALAKALELDPAHVGIRLAIGTILLRHGQTATARDHFRAELKLRPTDPRLLLALSNRLMDTGASRAALACLKWLVSLAPDDVDGWLNLAVAQFARGQYQSGIASCQTTLQKDPKNILAMYNLALANEHLHHYDKALAWLRRASLLDPTDSAIRRLQLRLRVLRWRDALVKSFTGLLHPIRD